MQAPQRVLGWSDDYKGNARVIDSSTKEKSRDRSGSSWGTTETGMLNRFTGTPENKPDLISRVPMKRIDIHNIAFSSADAGERPS
jgi:hypothetical protein